VLEPRGDPDLALEALEVAAAGQRLLDRDLAAEPAITRPIPPRAISAPAT
jgi:hypothetical protein